MPRDGGFERNRAIGLLAELCAVDATSFATPGIYDDDHQIWRPAPDPQGNVPPKGKEKDKEQPDGVLLPDRR